MRRPLRHARKQHPELRRLWQRLPDRPDLHEQRMRERVRRRQRARPSFSNQGPTTACVSLRSNSNNCGAVGTLCTSGDACNDGTCTQMCLADANCQGSCVDEAGDPNHCGGCNTTCGTDQVCVNGACVSSCASGQTACGRTCVDLKNSVNNCGACYKDCPNGQACVNGACTATCAPGSTNCGGNSSTSPPMTTTAAPAGPPVRLRRPASRAHARRAARQTRRCAPTAARRSMFSASAAHAAWRARPGRPASTTPAPRRAR